jgi:hypothetical protein
MSKGEKWSVVVILTLVAVGFIESYPIASLSLIATALIISFIKENV